MVESLSDRRFFFLVLTNPLCFFRFLLLLLLNPPPSQNQNRRAMPGKDGGKAKVSEHRRTTATLYQSERGLIEREGDGPDFNCRWLAKKTLNAKFSFSLLSPDTKLKTRILQPLKKPKSQKAELDDDDLAFKAKQREVSVREEFLFPSRRFSQQSRERDDCSVVFLDLDLLNRSRKLSLSHFSNLSSTHSKPLFNSLRTSFQLNHRKPSPLRR